MLFEREASNFVFSKVVEPALLRKLPVSPDIKAPVIVTPRIQPVVPVILGPNITGTFGLNGADIAGGGAIVPNVPTLMVTGGSENAVHCYGFSFDASKSNSIYGLSDTVQPLALVLNYIIKY